MDELYDEEAVYETVLSEAERRHELERYGRIAATVEVDLADKGPLFLYVKGRRTLAIAALAELAEADPRDAVLIAQKQQIIKEFLQVSGWIRQRFADAEHAEQQIREEYDGNAGDEH